jgi:hypothetical protein
MTTTKNRTSYLVTIATWPCSIRLADSYTEATQLIAEHLGACVVGHPGDITDGGDRTLVWLTEDDADGDDGQHAIAQIVVRGGGL